jgi:hypothetical protein
MTLGGVMGLIECTFSFFVRVSSVPGQFAVQFAFAAM